jgi:TRAP-type C4-dicarboxylate transport system substrate-binding protein
MMRTIRNFSAAAVFAALAWTGSAQAQVINWQDHKMNPAGFWNVANEIAFAKKVEEATGGRFKINIFPAASAGFQDKQVLDALSDNLLPMGEVFGGHVGGQEPIMELMDLPLFVPGDAEFRFKLWDALMPLYADLLKKKYKVHLYDVMQLNPRRLYTKAPVKTLADMKGLKIRAIGPADAAFVRGLGAEATTTNRNELYTALQQKVVDGHMAAYGAHLSMKFNEVTEYIYETANAGPSFFVIVNEDALAKLPADIREKFLGMRKELVDANRKSYTELDPKARAVLIERGMKSAPVLPADQAKMREVAKPIIERWAGRLNPDSKKIYDTAKTMIEAHYAAGGQ